MSISTKKKNIIIAEWKTGLYRSKTALAKQYKLDPKTVTKFLMGINQDNADIVKVLVEGENSKKSLKNPIELRSVEKAVKTLTESEALITNLTVKSLEGLDTILEKGSVNKPIKMRVVDGGEEIQDVPHDLTPLDIKNCVDAIDKASLTLGTNQRHANSQVQINNTNAQQNNDVELSDIQRKKEFDNLGIPDPFCHDKE